MTNIRRIWWILPIVLFAGACSRKMSLQDEFSYDPPGSLVTTDKPITEQPRSTEWLDGQPLVLDTDFDGGRVNAVEFQGDSLLSLTISPENAPVNNSAWYAFRLISPSVRDVAIRLSYNDGDHRYIPKISRDGKLWEALELDAMRPDTAAGTLDFSVDVGPDTLWIAGQELMNSQYFADWSQRLQERGFVADEVFGTSRQGRPMNVLKISEDPKARKYVLIMGRQHPPEVTGSIALEAFVEAVAAANPLAEAFRNEFTTLAIPMVNPDGVDGGHWRHNAGGVDLNRDWKAFNQTETQQIRDFFLKIKEDPGAQVFFAMDFHSTQEDIFYTLNKDLPTEPEGFTDDWLTDIDHKLPHYDVIEESYGLEAPISKNWFYETFGCPAVTYEVGDEVDRALIRQVSRQAARSMMRLLLGSGVGSKE